MKICNNCLEVYFGVGDCPHCGSNDYDDIDRDTDRFTGGLDDERKRNRIRAERREGA